MFCFNGEHNVAYLFISIFFCNLNHIKTAVVSHNVVCLFLQKYGRIVLPICNFNVYDFFKITIASILAGLQLQPAIVLCI